MIYVLTADPNLAARYVARLSGQGLESVWYPPQELRKRATTANTSFRRDDEVHHLAGEDAPILPSIASIAGVLSRADGIWRNIGYHGPPLDDFQAVQAWLNEDQGG